MVYLGCIRLDAVRSLLVNPRVFAYRQFGWPIGGHGWQGGAMHH